jgi:acyl-CoA reductase-like NAD-dependent aldehyde dehydrogenase
MSAQVFFLKLITFFFAVVMKSSEVTPLATLKFAELVKEAGFPAVSSIVDGVNCILT